MLSLFIYLLFVLILVFDLLGDFTLMSKKQPKREEIEDKVARITHPHTHTHTLECFILRVLQE